MFCSEVWSLKGILLEYLLQQLFTFMQMTDAVKSHLCSSGPLMQHGSPFTVGLFCRIFLREGLHRWRKGDVVGGDSLLIFFLFGVKHLKQELMFPLNHSCRGKSRPSPLASSRPAHSGPHGGPLQRPRSIHQQVCRSKAGHSPPSNSIWQFPEFSFRLSSSLMMMFSMSFMVRWSRKA